MHRTVTSAIITVALLISQQAHIVFVQIVAWENMVTTYYEQTDALNEAIDMTFSGSFPCDSCSAISEYLDESNDEQENASIVEHQQLTLILPSESIFLYTPPAGQRLFVYNLTALPLESSPDTPPPRVSCA